MADGSFTDDKTLIAWNTPDGIIVARVYESYFGIKGQHRVGLVDSDGRVWHYDRAEIEALET